VDKSVRKRLIADFIVILIAVPSAAAVLVRGCIACGNAVDFEQIVATYPSPSHKLKLVVSTWSGGAATSSTMGASIVDGGAVRADPGCRVLLWKPRDFTEPSIPILDVKWLDDSRLVLTYPARLPFEPIATRCHDVDVVHVADPAEKNLRGYVCLDPAAKTFQPCRESRENRWYLLEAENAKGWRRVTATLDPHWSPDHPYPVCHWQMAYVEMSGIVRPRPTRRDADARQWEVTATEFTFASRSPREPCPQYFDPTREASP
jgi:hypothetical protein